MGLLDLGTQAIQAPGHRSPDYTGPMVGVVDTTGQAIGVPPRMALAVPSPITSPGSSKRKPVAQDSSLNSPAHA